MQHLIYYALFTVTIIHLWLAPNAFAHGGPGPFADGELHRNMMLGNSTNSPIQEILKFVSAHYCSTFWNDEQESFLDILRFGIGVKLFDYDLNYGDNHIPDWFWNNVCWYADDGITSNEFVNTIQYLLDEQIIQISLGVQTYQILSTTYDDKLESNRLCTGVAKCLEGTIVKVIDGDTLVMDRILTIYGETMKIDGVKIRLALINAQELDRGDISAKQFVENICPSGIQIVVNEDDLQRQGHVGRILGEVYCGGVNLNHALIESGYGKIAEEFCDTSEFRVAPWAQDCKS